jgi:hypothetical protein
MQKPNTQGKKTLCWTVDCFGTDRRAATGDRKDGWGLLKLKKDKEKERAKLNGGGDTSNQCQNEPGKKYALEGKSVDSSQRK